MLGADLEAKKAGSTEPAVKKLPEAEASKPADKKGSGKSGAKSDK